MNQVSKKLSETECAASVSRVSSDTEMKRLKQQWQLDIENARRQADMANEEARKESEMQLAELEMARDSDKVG